jgi:NAD(P)-dependent dehydrogenase (short-subunit alcohol dehydrogenase family)
MGKLENKRALITGSSSGIGAGVALAFAREGADVVVNYPGPEQQQAAEKIAEQVRAAAGAAGRSSPMSASRRRWRGWSRAPRRHWAASIFW